MNEKEVLERGYATTMEEWWFLVDSHWNKLIALVTRFAPRCHAIAVNGKEKKDPFAVYGSLNAAWEKAPDVKTIRSIPGWGALCDLCSDFPIGKKEKEDDGQETD